MMNPDRLEAMLEEYFEDDEFSDYFRYSVFHMMLRRSYIHKIAKEAPNVFKAFVDRDFVVHITRWDFDMISLTEVEGIRKKIQDELGKLFYNTLFVVGHKDNPLLIFFSTDKSVEEMERKLSYVREFTNWF